MSHIAIDARIINSSTGTYVERLLHYLQKIDSQNSYTVLVREKDNDYWKPTAKNFNVKVAEFDNYSFKEQIGLKQFLDKLSPDLVHFCMPQQPVLYSGLAVTTIHDLTLLNTYNSDKNWLIYHTKQLVGHFVFKRVARKSKFVITPTEFTKDNVVNFATIDKGRVVVTYEAAEHTLSVLEPYDTPFEKFIMYVGQYPNYKNIRRLGDAHQKLLEKHPDLGLVLVGKISSDTQDVQSYFESKHYKNIHFTGFVSNAQRDWLYSKTAAYVFPSLMEGFGLPGLEAMAAGAPVVSSNATCLPEVYSDAALYFDPTDIDEMATTIEKVISDENTRKSLIDKGHRQVKKYSWETMAQQTYDVYMRALEK